MGGWAQGLLSLLRKIKKTNGEVRTPLVWSGMYNVSASTREIAARRTHGLVPHCPDRSWDVGTAPWEVRALTWAVGAGVDVAGAYPRAGVGQRRQNHHP